MNDDRRLFDVPPHPWYGPCDAFGGKGQWCCECARLIHEALDDFRCDTLHGFWAQIAIAALLGLLVVEMGPEHTRAAVEWDDV